MLPCTIILTRCEPSTSCLTDRLLMEVWRTCWLRWLLVTAPWKLPMVLMPAGKGFTSSDLRMALWLVAWRGGGAGEVKPSDSDL